jgi:transposase
LLAKRGAEYRYRELREELASLETVRPDRDPDPVRRFDCLTADLHRLADWLQQCGVTTVAMQSTGVYWIPVHEILDARGLEVYLGVDNLLSSGQSKRRTRIRISIRDAAMSARIVRCSAGVRGNGARV